MGGVLYHYCVMHCGLSNFVQDVPARPTFRPRAAIRKEKTGSGAVATLSGLLVLSTQCCDLIFYFFLLKAANIYRYLDGRLSHWLGKKVTSSNVALLAVSLTGHHFSSWCPRQHHFHPADDLAARQTLAPAQP